MLKNSGSCFNGNIKKGDVDKKEMIIHTQITKPLDQYKQVGPHVIAARKIEEHGIKVTRGTIVQYIITKGKGVVRYEK